MILNIQNFGGITSRRVNLTSLTLPNGGGKTTILNAYLFALTGKCLTGFEPRRVDATESEDTKVIIQGMFDFPEIERYIIGLTSDRGLLVGGYPATQTDFESVLQQKDINVELLRACANPNVLASENLTADDLRKILSCVGVLDGEELNKLKREQKAIREKLTNAQRYALTNVTLTPYSAEPLSLSECAFIVDYEKALGIVERYNDITCPACKRAYEFNAAEQKVRNEALRVAKKRFKDGAEEYKRLQTQADTYVRETAKREADQRLIDGATKARADVKIFEAKLKDLDIKIQTLQSAAVQKDLPEGVEIVTEIKQKNGSTRPTCTLTYENVPLKSVNYAKRVEICVRLLAAARNKQGEKYPIILDNAESVQGLDDIPNLIRLTVG